MAPALPQSSLPPIVLHLLPTRAVSLCSFLPLPAPSLPILCLPAISRWRSPVAMSLSFGVAELSPRSAPRSSRHPHPRHLRQTPTPCLPPLDRVFFFPKCIWVWRCRLLLLNMWFAVTADVPLHASNLFACPCQARSPQVFAKVAWHWCLPRSCGAEGGTRLLSQV